MRKLWHYTKDLVYNPEIVFKRPVQNHRAQVHIRGYGAVHIGGAEFEARKRRKVDLISFDMVIKIRVVKFKCTTEHSYISSYCYSFPTS